MRALVVDDSRAVRMILGKMMRELGFETVEAEHGIEALSRLESGGSPDIALVDWNMPEMDGYTFLCQVRADARFADMQIMMVTTETEMHQVIRALDAGANEYLMKPFTKEAVAEKLQLLGLLDAV
jgi:two-component system chemotaxis response regulator CheY